MVSQNSWLAMKRWLPECRSDNLPGEKPTLALRGEDFFQIVDALNLCGLDWFEVVVGDVLPQGL